MITVLAPILRIRSISACYLYVTIYQLGNYANKWGESKL